MNFVDWLMYVPDDVFEPYYNEFEAFTEEKKMLRESMFARFARRQGKAEGEIAGLRRGLKAALEIKFGKAGLDFAKRLQKVDALDQLNAVEKSLLTADSIDDLKKLIS